MSINEILEDQRISLLAAIGCGHDRLSVLKICFAGEMSEGTIYAHLKTLEHELNYIKSHERHGHTDVVYTIENNPHLRRREEHLDLPKPRARSVDQDQVPRIFWQPIDEAYCHGWIKGKPYVTRYVLVESYDDDEFYTVCENAEIAIKHYAKLLISLLGLKGDSTATWSSALKTENELWDASIHRLKGGLLSDQRILSEIDFIQEYREDNWGKHSLYELTSVLPIFAELGVTPPPWPNKALEHVRSGNLSDLEKVRLVEVNEICADNGWPLFEPEEDVKSR